MAGTGTELSQYVNWPTYAGYGKWELTHPQTGIPGSGSSDLLISDDQLPSNQYALKYNTYASEIPIDVWAQPPGSELFMSYVVFTELTFATFDSSYKTWLDSGGAYSSTLDIAAAYGKQSRTTFGIMPPTFEYNILDKFKETVRYGMRGVFSVVLQAVTMTFLAMDSFYGYLEYICRSKMKSLRLYDGEINSVAYVSGKGGSGDWTYNISSTLRNDVVDQIDFSSDELFMTVYKTDKNGITTDEIQENIKVKSIRGLSIIVEAPSPSDAKDIVPVGWSNSYFKFSKTVLVRDPQTLYADRELTSPGINDFVKETNLGYETREQQISDSGELNGIYASRTEIISLLNRKISDVKTYSAAQITEFKSHLDFVNGTENQVYGGKIVILKPEDFIYGSFSNPWGKILLGYVKELKSQYITLDIAIGGGTTQRHNMKAGCLAGEYFKNNDGTFRVSGHIRNSIYQLSVISKTSKINLIDHLCSLSSLSGYNFSVDSSRMWFINDIIYGKSSQSSCDKALFWGNITSSPVYSEEKNETTINYKIEDYFKTFSSSAILYQRFMQSVSPTSTTLLKKWNDNKKSWRLNASSDAGEYEIKNIIYNQTTDDFTLTISGATPSAMAIGNSSFYWISFDTKFEISGGYNYISTPYLAMNGALAGKKGQGYTTITIDGMYVGLPLREPLPTSSLVSVVLENGGVYENPNLPPIVYISTTRSGETVYLCRNSFFERKMLLYMKKEDEDMSLFIRSASMNFKNNIEEHLVYYGDADHSSDGISVTGNTGESQRISLGNKVEDHLLVGITFDRKSEPPVYKNGKFDYSLWQLYQGNFPLGYTSTSGLVSTDYTRREGKYSVENKDYVADYKPSTIVSNSGNEMYVAANFDNKAIDDKKTLILNPVYNKAESSQIDKVKIHWVPKENVVKNVTSPYLYTIYKKTNCVLYCKKQIWLRDGDSSNVSFSSTALLVKRGKIRSSEVFDPSLIIDPAQDGVFALMSTDLFKTYHSGFFGKPNDWVAPGNSGATDPGQKISEIPDSSLGERVLYKIPFLVAPNITRCAYAQDDVNVDIVGFSGLKASENDNDFSVLSIVHYRINMFNIDNYPVYIVKDNQSRYVFSYCDMPYKIKRIVAKNTVFQNDKNPAPVFTDLTLSEGSLSVATWDNYVFIAVQQASGIIYFISSDGGSNWAYVDDVPLIYSASATLSSPSIKIYDGTIWCFYIVNSQDLYLKKIPVALLTGFSQRYLGKKSSDEQDSMVINEKNNIRNQLNDRFPSFFVKQIGDQQVSFEMDNDGLLHIVYLDNEGGIRGISSSDEGKNWDFSPVNF